MKDLPSYSRVLSILFWPIFGLLLIAYLLFLCWPRLGEAWDLGILPGLVSLPLLTVLIWLLISAPVRSTGLSMHLWALVVGIWVIPFAAALLSFPFGFVLEYVIMADYLVPFIEEAVKLLPLVLILVCKPWRWVRAGFGAVDLAVLGLIIGTGFDITESLLRLRVIDYLFSMHYAFDASWGPLGLFPHAPEATGSWGGFSDPFYLRGPSAIAMGHGVWTGLIGLGLGLSLMIGKRIGPFRWTPLVVLGAIVLWEHIAFNSMNGYGRNGPPDWMLFSYVFLTQGGRLSGYLFAVGTIGAGLWTAWVVYVRRDPTFDLQWRQIQIGENGSVFSRLIAAVLGIVFYMRIRVGVGIALLRHRGGTADLPSTERVLLLCQFAKGVLEHKLPKVFDLDSPDESIHEGSEE